jgi:hypothetical protein
MEFFFQCFHGAHGDKYGDSLSFLKFSVVLRDVSVHLCVIALSNFEDFHHLIPQMVDHLDRDGPGGGFIKGAGGIVIER